MRTEGGSPNLINGVSRQPVEVRLPSQLDESVNQFPTVSRGLVPRNPSRRLGGISGAVPANATTHLIDRDSAERYVVTISPSGVQVHDLAGNAKTVATPNGIGYLSGALKGEIKALTVADYTFIVNTKKVVGTLADVTPSYPNGGLIHIVQGDYFTEYKVLVNGSVAASMQTEGGPYDSDSNTRRCERGARTSSITALLTTGSPPSGVDTIPSTAAVNLATSLPTWSRTVMDNVIYLQAPDATPFTLQVEAGGETKARAHKGTTQVFSELPRRAPNGFCIQVSGSEDTNFDDYYVRFDHPTGAANGTWKETVGPGIRYKLDPATMPHVLVREADGTFTFKQATWAERKVGDLETNPWPSFVGYPIREVMFHKSRLGFASGESVAFSRFKEFFDFFIESIITPLDTDPVDLSIDFEKPSDIRHAVAFTGELVLFTDSIPFRVAGGDTFTPKSGNFEPLLSNETSAQVRPVAAGSRMFFVNDAPSGSFVHEFLYDKVEGVADAPSITDHVQGYIPPNVDLMVVDEDLSCLVLGSAQDRKVLHLYKWLWIGQEKAQSAWQKWTLPHDVIAMRFIGEDLILVTDLGDRREVLSLSCHEAWEDPLGSTIHLDRRVSVTGTYDVNTDTTTFVLPYAAEGATIVVNSGEKYGSQAEVLSVTGNTVVVRLNFGGTAWAGFEYPSYGVLSELMHRPSNQNGGYGNGQPGMVTTIANLTFATNHTVYFDVDLTRAYRKAVAYRFSAALNGTKTGRVGVLVDGTITKTCSILSKAKDVSIRFGGRGPYTYSVMSYRWTGDAQPINY